MIDRSARNKAAELLRHVVSGSITVNEFVCEFPKASDDEAIAMVAGIYMPLFEDVMQSIASLHTDTMQSIMSQNISSIFDGSRQVQPYPEIPQIETLRLRGDYALSHVGQRRIARLVVFLHTDLEYVQNAYRKSSTKLNWWQAILLAPVVIIGLLLGAITMCAIMMATNILAGLLISAGIVTVICLTVEYFKGGRYWPFGRRKDYELALANPKLLAGKQA